MEQATNPAVTALRAVMAAAPGRLAQRGPASSIGRPRGPSCLDPLCGKTPSKELRHGRRSCGGFSLIGLDGNSAGVYPFRCHRWRCWSCGLRKVDQTRKRIRAGLAQGDAWFVTLTSPGDESPEDSLDQLSHRWKRLLLRVARRFGRIEYVTVIELQKRGSPHCHVLVRGPRIPKRWLERAATDAGFGKILHVAVPARGLAGYLTKAIGPNTSGDSLPAHFRRVRWSRGWSLPVVWRAKRVWQEWHVAFAGTARAAVSAIHRGYRIAELIHGPPDRRRSVWPVDWRPLASLRAGWGSRS